MQVECTNIATGKVYIHTQEEAEQMKGHPQTKGKFRYKVLKEKMPTEPVAKKASPAKEKK